jgi:hypothetical protein
MSSTVTTASTTAHPSSTTLKSIAQGFEARLAKDLSAGTTTEVPSATPSSTVTLSSAGIGMLKSLGQSAVNVVKGAAESALDAVEVPFDAAKDIATGVVSAVEGVGKAGWDLGSGQLESIMTDAGSAVRSLVADAPATLTSDLKTDVESAGSDLLTLAKGALGVSSLGSL